MDIKTIGVEEWLNVWEKSATWDIAQSTISSLTMGELRALDEQDGATFYERLDREKMNYGWIEGSPEFKAVVAKLYRREVNPDHILQTNGCTGANLNAIMAVVEPATTLSPSGPPTRRSTRFRARWAPRSSIGSFARNSAGSPISRNSSAWCAPTPSLSA